MLSLIQKDDVWRYLSAPQQDLILEGKFLIDIVRPHRFKDYSFIVFPYAKTYEGYLKQLFLDVGFIRHEDYISDHFRVGKYLSPHMMGRLGDKSVYAQIRERTTDDLAQSIWHIWKKCRNQVIHYYPHNLKRVTYDEARDMIDDILNTMSNAYRELKRLEYRI
ncbi:hypothetical protein CO051_06860 [Candidatus Roizmanbacteria bacterium CG_4_9_14_0_2_um_filter_39_13]|uniref:Bacterial toxin RNase RnlA/LsoA DBD domain-containing protein n=2 Tax=Candidatus Roizmaniibacteriota TaxID=1752723 RepID=A0A2M8EWH6_9BACT|nr:MAG: hypothetical protein COY15_00770 [Candidatus Roizmanbacteria bacterium CG_4_10_14_0_2_um_filter_39_12]PJC30226.1 MAG: hypothetical protein CO051_06860 [Candidatus Roizmanbacteria bacterium CG_4_9_14_0_2_um_filter_39_13]PJE61468.1 MAG: hypothetical protein COU87_04490 [Candidatus Roizmanbacteria bacterium CG10_big_fil_rev_8_21_14_0_10_39_12]